MRILLTGSSGWLGRTLAPLLRAAGHRVTGLDIAPGLDPQIVGSVADKELIERTFGEQGIEAVIHGGALHKPDIARHPAGIVDDSRGETKATGPKVGLPVVKDLCNTGGKCRQPLRVFGVGGDFFLCRLVDGWRARVADRATAIRAKRTRET